MKTQSHPPSVLASVILLLMASLAPAQTVPLFINYQGKVTDSNGVGIGTSAPENRKMIFRLYNAATAGTLLWTEEQTVTLSGGEFSVLLGQGIVFGSEARPALDTVFTSSGTGRFLQITVDNGDGNINGSDTPITPRQQITSTAYSFRARAADTIAAGSDLTLNNSANYGLGWYGTGRTFATTAIDGPVLYGNAGGALGSYNGTTQATALRWNASGQVGIGTATIAGAAANTKLVLQGDDTGAPPLQLNIRGNTDTNKRLLIGYNTTSNYGALQAYNGASTATNLVLNQAGGNVGIGTAAPTSRLQVNGGNVTMYASGASDSLGYSIHNSASAERALLGMAGTTGAYSTDAVLGDTILRASNGKLLLQSGSGASAIAVTTGNNVGIGTSSPGVKLDVNGIAQSHGLELRLNAGTPYVDFSSTTAGDYNARIIWQGGATNRLDFEAPTFAFLTGNVGIGTTTPGDKLHIKGGLRLENDAANHYRILVDSFNSLRFQCNLNGGNYAYLNSNTSGLISTSDRRVKKDISPMQDCLARIMKLTPSTFRYNTAEPGSPLNYGFIAQDVELQFPDIVQEREGLKRLASAAFEGINVRAIQELKTEKDAEVKSLKDENDVLKARVAELEAATKDQDARLAAIEKALRASDKPEARTASINP